MRTIRLYGVLCCLLFVLTACSMPVTRTDSAAKTSLLNWNERLAYLQQTDEWGVSGRIAMRTPEDAWSASLKWQQRDTDFDIQLFGPLGGKALSVTGGKDYVVLTTDEGETFSEQNAAALIYRQTGWHVPVDSLHYWARAMQIPGQDALVEHDKNGRLTRLQQAGWDIHYQDYQVVDQLEMPRKLRLENKNFTVKLIFRGWQLGQRS